MILKTQRTKYGLIYICIMKIAGIEYVGQAFNARQARDEALRQAVLN